MEIKGLSMEFSGTLASFISGARNKEKRGGGTDQLVLVADMTACVDAIISKNPCETS